MTTTADRPAAPARTRLHPAALVPLTVAGACWTAGQAVLPDMGLQLPERYDAVAQARGLQALSTVLLFLAGSALVVAALALARAAGRAPRLVSLGTVLLGLGGVWLCAGRAAFNLHMLSVTAPDVPRDEALTVLENTSPAFAVFPLTLLALLLGPLLLAVAVRRATWLPLVLWVGGIGLFVVSEFQVKALEVAGIGLAAVALVLLGWHVPGAVGTAVPAVRTPGRRPRA